MYIIQLPDIVDNLPLGRNIQSEMKTGNIYSWRSHRNTIIKMVCFDITKSKYFINSSTSIFIMIDDLNKHKRHVMETVMDLGLPGS